MIVKNILISLPKPVNGSQCSDIIEKFNVGIDFCPFFKAEPISVRDFRTQKISILDYTAIVFTSKVAIDAFFKICEEMRVVVPETMKYFCVSEAIALYLQKYIVYRKRKIFFGNGSVDSVVGVIGSKHKDETFLLTYVDTIKEDLEKQFVKAKLKHNHAILVQTRMSDLKEINLSKYQVVVLYSPMDVKSLQENYPDFQQKSVKFITFGPTAAKAMKAANFDIEIEAPTPEVPSVVKALQLFLESE